MVPVRTFRLTPAFAVTPGKDFQTSDSSTANVESLIVDAAWFITRKFWLSERDSGVDVNTSRRRR